MEEADESWKNYELEETQIGIDIGDMILDELAFEIAESMVKINNKDSHI